MSISSKTNRNSTSLPNSGDLPDSSENSKQEHAVSKTNIKQFPTKENCKGCHEDDNRNDAKYELSCNKRTPLNSSKNAQQENTVSKSNIKQFSTEENCKACYKDDYRRDGKYEIIYNHPMFS